MNVAADSRVTNYAAERTPIYNGGFRITGWDDDYLAVTGLSPMGGRSPEGPTLSRSLSPDQEQARSKHLDEPGPRVGEYTWADFLDEHGYGDEIEALYRTVEQNRTEHSSRGVFSRIRGHENTTPRQTPAGEDWDVVSFDPDIHLGFHPDTTSDLVRDAFETGADVQFIVNDWLENTPVTKDAYTWEHFKYEYYYDENGLRPRDDAGRVIPFDPDEYLGHPLEAFEEVLDHGIQRATDTADLVEERTVNVDPDLEEDAFFSTVEEYTTVVNRYDLEQAVAMEKKPHLHEVERYWVDKPFAFVIIFHSTTENEQKYYLVNPHLNPIEENLKEYLTGKLRTTIKYADDVVIDATHDEATEVIESELEQLLSRYGLLATSNGNDAGWGDQIRQLLGTTEDVEFEPTGQLDGLSARPMPAILAEDPDQLTEYQVRKLEHLLTRDFIGYGAIDGIKHDVSVEDISCDGYNSPVFVYHSEYEQLITNVIQGKSALDRFVVKLAQRSGKSISKRHPQVDATLPDGSRAQLTLGREVSDHGTNYTIRQFNDVPFTPVDLINWHTFSLEQMVFLWLAIENQKSILFAGGTASGKTTSLNAVSLFIPSNAKIVSIEDTREVELPQRNWIASITRPAFSDDDEGDVDEFDLLEAALRQRPEYIVMGEVRGEEGRTLFQVMSTGHTTMTTFHADSVGEVLKRFTTDPINVSKTMFTALDLVSVQSQTRMQGQKVRRNKGITEINRYDTERDEINVRDIYEWKPETDEFSRSPGSKLLDEIMFDRGWSEADLEEELFKRRVVLAYLVSNGLNKYAQVAATIQAFINDPDTVLALLARGRLTESLDDLRGMESVLIDIEPEKEALVPRPEVQPQTKAIADEVLEEAEDRLFETYRELTPSPLVEALPTLEPTTPVVPVAGAGSHLQEPTAPGSTAIADGQTDGGVTQTEAPDDPQATVDARVDGQPTTDGDGDDTPTTD